MPLRAFGVRQATTDRLHRCGIRRLYKLPNDRWKRFGCIRPLHSGSGDVPEEGGQGKVALQENGWEPWVNTKNWTPTAKANQVDDKNIVVGDLKATLEAHRTANRLHKIWVPERAPPPSEDFRRLDLSEQKDVDTGTNEAEATSRLIQRQGATGTKIAHFEPKRGKYRRKRSRPVPKARVEDYEGQDRQPNASWRLVKIRHAHSPWINSVESTAIPGIQR